MVCGRLAAGVALCKALGARLPGGGLLFYEEKQAKDIYGKFVVACRRRGAFCKGIVSTARRGGLPFAPAKGSKTGQRGTKLSPLQTPLTLSCAGYERHFSAKKPSVLHADGLQKCLRRIFIAAALERRTANHHPCPLLGGGELWGGKANTF